jgi:hypothetical protein
MLAGVALAVSYWAGHLVLRDLISIVEIQYPYAFLTAGSFAMGLVIFDLSSTLFGMMGTLLLMVLVRFVFRRLWIGDAAFVLLLSALHVELYTHLQQTITMAVWETLTIVAYFWILRRYGLLSLAIFGFVGSMMVYPPVDWSRWYAGRALMVQLIPVAIAAWALWVVLPAQKWASGSEPAP